jgi:hypothetical protein
MTGGSAATHAPLTGPLGGGGQVDWAPTSQIE